MSAVKLCQRCHDIPSSDLLAPILRDDTDDTINEARVILEDFTFEVEDEVGSNS